MLDCYRHKVELKHTHVHPEVSTVISRTVDHGESLSKVCQELVAILPTDIYFALLTAFLQQHVNTEMQKRTEEMPKAHSIISWINAWCEKGEECCVRDAQGRHSRICPTRDYQEEREWRQ